jgi:hypothetical protein
MAPSVALIASSRLGLVLLIGLSVCVGGTWPYALQVADTVPGVQGDQSFYIWMFDTVARNILAGRWPFWTDRIFYPTGYNLMQSTSAPALALLSVPFLHHLPLYIGLLSLLSLAGAVGTVVLLTGVMRGSLLTGLLLGSIYALGPVRDAVVRAHVVPAIAAMLVPLMLVAAHRAAQSPTWRRLIVAMLVLWLIVSTYIYYGIVALLVSSGALLALPSWRLCRRVAALAVANGLVYAYVVAHLEPVSIGGLWSIANADARDLTRAMLAFLVPGLLGCRAWQWYAGAAACVLLSLGGNIRLDSTVFATPSFMPWVWMSQHSAIWATMDIPRYFALGATVGLMVPAIVAARKRPILCNGMLAAALVWIVASSSAMPLYRLNRDMVPAVYHELAALPSGTLLEIPGGITESKSVFGWAYGRPNNNEMMFFQTIHQHRRTAGHVSRAPAALYRELEGTPVMGDLLVRTSPAKQWAGKRVSHMPAYKPLVIDEFITHFGLRYVLVAPDDPDLLAEVRGLFAGRVARERTIEDYTLLELSAS